MPESKAEASLDAQILLALQVSARATWREVADALHQHESTVARRARRLVAEGHVQVTGVVDHLRVGKGLSVYMRFQAKPNGVMSLAEAVANHPAVRFVAITTGSFDVVAEAVVATPNEIFAVRDEIYAAQPFLQAQTSPVIRKFTAYEDWTPEGLAPEAVESLKQSRHWVPYSHSAWRDQETLTPTELLIIENLRQDGRMTYQDLAGHVGVSPTVAKKLTTSLVQRGCLRFRTLIDADCVGYNSEFLAWLSVTPECIESAGEYLKNQHASRYAALTMDESNILLHGLLPHYSDTYAYMTNAIAKVPGLVKYQLSLVMHSLKRAWVPVRSPSPGISEKGIHLI